jgi:hypothetical protein
MKVILLTDVPKVGNRYDVKDFADGYAKNVLIAKGLAELATPHALMKLTAPFNIPPPVFQTVTVKSLGAIPRFKFP